LAAETLSTKTLTAAPLAAVRLALTACWLNRRLIAGRRLGVNHAKRRTPDEDSPKDRQHSNVDF